VVVALTATAAPPVREDIVRHLGMRDAAQVVAGFDRPNLWLEVRRYTEDAQKRTAVLEQAVAEPKPGLVYTATRKDAEALAAALRGHGVAAASYHAGMKSSARKAVHDGFLDDELEVVVATSAFGMGIDKPNVRFVLHASVPESVDAYYQEVGRAGRDGQPATAVLFYRSEDLGLRRFFSSGGADPDVLAGVATALRDSDGPLTRADLRTALAVSPQRVARAVNLLGQVGAVRARGRSRTALRYSGGEVADAVAAAAEVAEARKRIDQSRIEMMRGYAETLGCRREYLLGYFGESYPAPCDGCDACAAGGPAATAAAAPGGAVPDPGPYPLNTRVRHVEWGEGVVMREEPDRVTVLFEDVGYRTLSLATVEEQDLLAVVGT
jgi:ATP-dependent DNA helicase RecQ